MSKFSWQVLVCGLTLCALVLITGSLYLPIAQAQNVPSNIRIMHLPQWYTQNLATNTSATNNLNYYNGLVMTTGSQAYAIYWVPPGRVVDPNYETLVNRYFGDIGGSSFKIATQYYQNPNRVHIANVSALAAWTVDTAQYPGLRGTSANPLTDSDIRQEVIKVAAAKGWKANLSNMFFVFTALGVESCINSSVCTPGTPNPAYSAYHGYFKHNAKPYIYANMPYAATWGALCGTFTQSPNNDPAADTEISITSHEHFEAVTDLNPPPQGPKPGTTAWTDSQGYEIGDKCAYTYGTTASDGSNIAMNGHPYIMQLEWSNRINGCAKSY